MKKEPSLVTHKRFIDEETGEVFDTPIIYHKGKGNTDFEMIFYGHLLDVLNELGNKKILVLQYIIKNREKVNNTFIGTVQEVATALNISHVTVNNTLVLLEDKGAIKRKRGVVYIDANLICDGRFKDRIMHIYNDLEEETTDEKEAKIQREIQRTEQHLRKLESLKSTFSSNFSTKEKVEENIFELELV
jgi:predicted transcriptional regulator